VAVAAAQVALQVGTKMVILVVQAVAVEALLAELAQQAAQQADKDLQAELVVVTTPLIETAAAAVVQAALVSVLLHQ
jgi:hypothetical protein